MAFGKGDGTVEHPQLGEVRATCVLCQAEISAYILRIFVQISDLKLKNFSDFSLLSTVQFISQ